MSTPTEAREAFTPDKGIPIESHLLSALEDTRDLLCAFHRDYPQAHQPRASYILRTGLAVIERAKVCPSLEEQSTKTILAILDSATAVIQGLINPRVGTRQSKAAQLNTARMAARAFVKSAEESRRTLQTANA